MFLATTFLHYSNVCVFKRPAALEIIIRNM